MLKELSTVACQNGRGRRKAVCLQPLYGRRRNTDPRYIILLYYIILYKSCLDFIRALHLPAVFKRRRRFQVAQNVQQGGGSSSHRVPRWICHPPCTPPHPDARLL